MLNSKYDDVYERRRIEEIKFEMICVNMTVYVYMGNMKYHICCLRL